MTHLTKQLTQLSFFSLFTLLLTGCEREMQHDENYFFERPEECKSQIEKCQADPIKLNDTLNCINAKKAYHRRVMEGDGSGKMPKIRK